MKNKFCDSKVLQNEADVETFFILALMKDLGFESDNIKPKRSLNELSVKKIGSRRAVKYRPDYGIVVDGQIRLIIEAKSPSENINDHILQPRDYCATINGEYPGLKPVKYFMLSNGNQTQLFKHDLNNPLLTLDFQDFFDGSEKYKEIKNILSLNALRQTDVFIDEDNSLLLKKSPLKDVNEAFSWCHQFIYKNDNISQGAAFMEFVKIIALKLLSDRGIRDKYPQLVVQDDFLVPLTDVKFSRKLLADQEKHTPNPLSSIWFADFIQEMEHEIATRKKKRIFEKNDQINLTPETIHGVVSKLEHLFLFGIDADLNGRLFETFLSATMRGKDLGQYFTPRSIVKLGVGLAGLKINAKDISLSDRVYDGCCGTGGFLIDVLADMWVKIDKNPSLSIEKKEKYKQHIAYGHIFGADIGRDPNLSRIARLNMYLHGDGGSCIYNVDALDKELPDHRTDKPEMASEKQQMRDIYAHKDGFFDVVITNPPFAKKYSIAKTNNKDQVEISNAERILSQYSLRTFEGGKTRTELRSNLMFMEKYYDVLKKGGRLLTVIDDGILSGKDYHWFREWLREKFIVNAVISLPGDAFQRSMARVKTSLLVLTKKTQVNETQPSVFMYPCIYVGIDDPARSRTLPVDAINKQKAKEEVDEVIAEYNNFLEGNGSGKYIVESDRLGDRLDVKHCLMTVGGNISFWKTKKFDVVKIKDALEIKDFSGDDLIECSEHASSELPLIVRYDGSSEPGSAIFPADTQHNRLYRVSEGDIVISNIAASYGSIAVVPAEQEGCVVSSEYTVLRVKDGFKPKMLWAILRSPVVLSEILLIATGANRTRVKWDALKSLSIPYPQAEREDEFVESLTELERIEKEAAESKKKEIDTVVSEMGLINDYANVILSAFKPPK